MVPMTLPDLEGKCWKCWGSGVVPWNDHAEVMDCPECGGIGWIPTDDGKRLLDFLKRHLALDVEEEEEPVE
jgi:hypothetical protein